MRRALALLVLSGALVAPSLRAEPALADRVVVRFTAPETGGARSPRFVLERVLAFEARLEALGDPDHVVTDERPYRERHVRAALERHVAETLLASLRIDPEPTERELVRTAQTARTILYQRAKNPVAVERARAAEGIDDREILRMLRRQARASLYLDRMVAPMLAPSRAELEVIHRTLDTPFAALPFDQAQAPLARWTVALRLSEALATFYQNARSRLELTIVS